MIKQQPQAEIKIAELAPGGNGFGRLEDGRAAFILGGIPGETVLAELTKQKSSYVEGRISQITTPSLRRTEPPRYDLLGAMPWYCLAYDYQLELKLDLLKRIFMQHHLELSPDVSVTPSPQTIGYRSRLDYSLYSDDDGLQLAHFKAGSSRSLELLNDGHPLASTKMNEVATKLTAILSTIPALKAVARLLILRTDSKNSILALIGVTAVPEPLTALGDIDLSSLGLAGLAALRCDRRRTIVHNSLFYETGETQLKEELDGLTLSYGPANFTQQNMPAFRLALGDLLAFVSKKSRVLELYAGSGTIGLSVAKIAATVEATESVASASIQALQNAQANGITNYHSHALEDRHTTVSQLKAADILIVDPPRAGLHPRLVETILACPVERIIYLSCNPVTQARDIALLQGAYTLKHYQGYDFYPQTAHLEGLAILDQK